VRPDCEGVVGRIFKKWCHTEVDATYREKEYEFLSGSYQRAYRDGYLEKNGKKIKVGENNPHSYFSS